MRYLVTACLVVMLAAGCGDVTESPQPAKVKPNQAQQTEQKKEVPPAKGTTVALEIEGMHCDSCAGWVEDILEKLDGVADADVSYQKHTATVRMKPGAAFPETAARDELDKENYKLKPLTAHAAK